MKWFKRKPRLDRAAMLEAAQGRYNELRAKYDAALTTAENAKHWAAADSLGPSESANHSVRYTLRKRARYEILQNSSLGRGIILKKAKDVIGRGPVLQMQIARLGRFGESASKTYDARIQQAFNSWAKAANFNRVLATAYSSYVTDGEVFCVATTNEQTSSPVSLALRLYEGDQVTDRDVFSSPQNDDGIRYDDAGFPVSYTLLSVHPGSVNQFALPETVQAPANQVIHLFREDRPGQRRGIPHVAPALPLFAFRRRYLLATVAAAEIAADFAAVISTSSSAYNEPAEVDPFSAVEIDRGMMVSMPEGWQMSQLKADQPTTTFEMFDNCLIAEVSRCLGMPYARAAGNSSGFTYASGKLDRDDYLEQVEVEQHDIASIVCDRVFRWWLAEAAFVPGLLPERVAAAVRNGFDELPHTWVWESKRETDPSKQAQADKIYHELGLMTDADFWARQGKDTEEQYEKLAAQTKIREEIGVPAHGSQQASEAATTEETPENEQEAVSED